MTINYKSRYHEMLGEALEIDFVERKLMRRDEQKTQLIVVLLIVLNFMFFRKKIQSNVNHTKLFMEFSTREFSLTLFSKKTIRHLDLK